MYKTLFVARPDRIKHRKHTNQSDWLNVYYFTNRQNRKLIYKNDYFRKNSLYYETLRSENSITWDYYKILKPSYNKFHEVALEKQCKLDIVKSYKEISKYDKKLEEIRNNKKLFIVNFD